MKPEACLEHEDVNSAPRLPLVLWLPFLAATAGPGSIYSSFGVRKRWEVGTVVHSLILAT